MISSTEQVRCFACGGQIRSLPGTARGICQHCGAETASASESHSAEAVRVSELTDEMLVRSQTLPCQNCSAEFPAGSTVLSTICPFCDTALIRADVHVHKHLPIRQLIPFNIDETAARAAIDRFLDGAAGVPRKRKSEILAQVQLQPVFLSYYLFDADLELKTRVRNTNTVSDFEVLSREVELAGWVEGFLVPGCETQGIFASIPSIDGQAWHLQDLQPYDHNALAGALATFPAVPAQEAIASAQTHLDAIVSQRIRGELENHEAHGPLRYGHKDEWVRAVLVPVWLGQYFVDNHQYRVRVNGQTGESGVEVPVPRDADFWQLVIYLVVFGFVGIWLVLVGEDMGWWSRD